MTPRTQRLIDNQGQELFYSGTPENVQQILWSQIKEWELLAATLEKELIAKEKQSNLMLMLEAATT